MADNYTPELPKERYEELKKFRNPYLTRAKDYAKVTIPYVMPETEDEASTEKQLEFSGTGAGLVTHLANRYMQELFPVNRSFFKLQIDESERAALGEETPEDANAAGTDTLLTKAERRGKWAFEQRKSRPTLLDMLKHVIITGNACLYYPPDGSAMQMYALDEYVLYVDTSGKLLELIISEKKSIMGIPSDIRQGVIDSLDLGDDADLSQEQATLYTYVRIDPENDEQYLVNQSIEDQEVPDSEASYPAEFLPWLPQVWNRTRREIYGRGLVEDHYGSFWVMSVLSEALVTGAATMSDIKYLVRPGSILDINALNKAASGTYHYGVPDDVSAITSDKQGDYAFIQAVIQSYEQKLGKAFLSVSSQIRDSERTTAEENRLRAMELDQSHGGVFSNFSITLQDPLATLILRDIDLNLEGTSIDPVIVTGLDAMSRAATNEKIRLWINDMAGTQALPEQALARLDFSALGAILANGRDVDVSTIVITEEQANARAQAAQAEQAAETIGSEMVKKASPEQMAEMAGG